MDAQTHPPRCKDGCCPNSKPYPLLITIVAAVGFLFMLVFLASLLIAFALGVFGVPGLIGLGVIVAGLIAQRIRALNRQDAFPGKSCPKS